MEVSTLIKRRSAQKAVISRHLSKIDDINDDVDQFRTVLEALQNRFNAMDEINESIVTLIEDDDYETEIIETADYMLELKILMQKLEKRHPVAAVQPPPPTRNVNNNVDTTRVIIPPADPSTHSFQGTASFSFSSCRLLSSSSSCATDTPSHPAVVPSSTPVNAVLKDDAIFNVSSPQQPSHVLLKTAVAPVYHDVYCADANILFDEGAQQSFITEKLARVLQLTPDGTDVVKLATFGDTAKNVRSLDTATVYVKTERGDKLPIRVLIVPMIATPLNNSFQRGVADLTYLRGLKLAHPVSNDDCFDISLLIGADFYWSFLQNKTIRGEGPTAVQSKLGYLLSGSMSLYKTVSPRVHAQTIITTHIQGDIESKLERFWSLESMGITDPGDEPDTSKLTEYQANATTYSDSKYTAKLPWKPDRPTLSSSYSVNEYGTESTIRRLCGDRVSINDRPLTHVSSSVADPEPLNPSHLLLGRRLTSLPYPDVTTDADVPQLTPSTARKQVSVLHELLDKFWTRWRCEYLTELREHHKVTENNKQSVTVEDVVQVHDDAPRSQWKLAVIEELILGNDGYTRAAKIRTSGKLTNRPITKLYPLEVI